MSKCVCRLNSSCPTCFPHHLFTVHTQTLPFFLKVYQYVWQLDNFDAMTWLCRHRGEVQVQLHPIDKLGARSVWVLSATPTPFLPSGKTRHPSYRRFVVKTVKATCENCNRGFGCNSTNDYLSEFKKKLSVCNKWKH